METIDITLGIEDFEWLFWLLFIPITYYLWKRIYSILKDCRALNKKGEFYFNVFLLIIAPFVAFDSVFYLFRDRLFENKVKDEYSICLKGYLSKGILSDAPLYTVKISNPSYFKWDSYLIELVYVNGQKDYLLGEYSNHQLTLKIDPSNCNTYISKIDR